jgi:hypothetical protein
MNTTARIALLIQSGLTCCTAWGAVERDPVEIGKWPPTYNGGVFGVVTHEQYAYCAMGGASFGTLVVDVSNPTNPVPAAFQQDRSISFILGNLAYGGGPGSSEGKFCFEVSDLSDPVHPQPLGCYETVYGWRNVVVSDNHAYLVGGNVLQVMDVSDPANPQRVGLLTGGPLSTFEDVAVSGSYAYVADQRSALLVLDVSNPASPQMITNFPVTSFPTALWLANDHAFINTIHGTLLVIDLSNPASPQTVAEHIGTSFGVVSENRAYALRFDGLQVFDISDPANPKPDALYNFDWSRGYASLIAVSGDHAYLGGSEGLQVIDTKPPGSGPVTIGTLDTHFSSRFGPGFFANDRLLVPGRHKLFVLDVNEPGVPTLVGQYALPSDVAWVPPHVGWIQWTGSGDVAHASYRQLGGPVFLELIDVSDPQTPQFLARYEGPEAIAHSHVVSGNLVFLTHATDSSGTPISSWTGGFEVIDIGDPSNPQRIGSYNTTGRVHHAHLAGDHLFLAFEQRNDVPDGYELIDISIPSAPQFVKFMHPGRIDLIAGNRAYVRYATGDDSGTDVLDVSDPANPKLLRRWPGVNGITSVSDDRACFHPGTALEPWSGLLDLTVPASPRLLTRFGFGGRAPTVSGNHAFVPGIGAVRVFDLTSPANPRHTGRSFTGSEARAVSISGSHAYVADGANGLSVIDVSDSSSPQPAGGVDTPGSATDVFVSGQYAYVADWDGGLRVINISNPANPQFVAALALPDHDVNFPEVAERVVVSGHHAYVTGFGFHTIDVSNPLQPVRLGGYRPPGGATGVFVSGDHAYVTGYGLHIVDVSDPASPQLVGRFDPFPGLRFQNVFVAANYAYVANDSSLLFVVEVSDPANPRRENDFFADSSIRDIFISGSTAYLASPFAGLHVLDISDPAEARRVGGNPTLWSESGLMDITLSGQQVYVLTGRELHILNLYQPPDALRLEPLPALLPGSFRFLLHGAAGTTGQIERSDNVQTWTDWLPFSLGDGPVEFSDPTAGSRAVRFYRAVSP